MTLESRRIRGAAVVTSAVLLAGCGSAQQTASTPVAAPSGSTSAPSSTASPSASGSESSAGFDPLTHHLLAEDFADGPGVFHTGATSDFAYAVAGGEYVIRVISSTGGVAKSFGEYARRAYSVDATVDVARTRGLGAKDAVGLACSDSTGKDGHMLMVTVDGRHAALLRWSAGMADTQSLATWSVPAAQASAVRSLRLFSHVTSPTGDTVALTAWINGVEAPKTAEAPGFVGCDGMLLIVFATAKGAEVRFDNARAVVPGE